MSENDRALRETSAGGVVIGPGGRIAIVSQKGRSWSLPKGRITAGEPHFDAALREIREETGLTELTLVTDLPPYERSPLNKPHYVKTLVFYLFRTEQTVLAPEDPHNPVAEWLAPRDAVERLSHPKDREFLSSVIERFGL